MIEVGDIMNDIDFLELKIDEKSSGYYIIQVNSPFNNDEQRYYLYSHDKNRLYKILSIGALIDYLNALNKPFEFRNVNNLERKVLIEYFNMLYEIEISKKKENEVDQGYLDRISAYYSKITGLYGNKKSNVDVFEKSLIDNKIANFTDFNKTDEEWINIYKLNNK